MLQIKNINKFFGETHVLEDLSLQINRGEIHALCGENGAGKSTLMKILSGVYPAGSFTGEFFLDGNKCDFNSINDSEEKGIAIIAQELALVPEMNIAENIFLGREPGNYFFVDKHEMHRQAKKIIQLLGITASTNTLVKNLGTGMQQLVEIAKALSKQAKYLLLDEPTSALTEIETETLIKILFELKLQGITLIIISHKLKEIVRLADKITVLRDGKITGTIDKNDATEEKIISLMVGRTLTDFYHKEQSKKGNCILETRNLFTTGNRKKTINNASIEVCEGEIVGLSGLMGSGRTELIETIYGASGQKIKGEIFVNGEKIDKAFPAGSIEKGMSFVTEDRKLTGLFLEQPVFFNSTISWLSGIMKKFLLPDNEIEKTKTASRQLNVKATSLTHQPVGELSGGNQQKVLLARCLMTNPKLVLLDEPTRGIDIGAKAEIYALINALVKKGTAVLIASSDLLELLGLCDKIYVMNNGSITGCMLKENATEEKIMTLATVDC